MTAIKRFATLATAAVAASVCAPAAIAEAGTTTSGATDHAGRLVVSQGHLRDLQPTAGPFDHARARVVMVQQNGHTLAVLHVRGIGGSAAGKQFGAHLHVGPCVAQNGAAAGPHYNADVAAGRVPPRIDQTTEVWLDFAVSRAGTGTAVTRVPFVPSPGNRSVVIHQEPTDPQGVAGPRLACLPVAW